MQLVTSNATQDEYTPEQYREMFDELRQTAGSMRKLAELLQSQFSHAYWNKYAHGEIELNREMRQELRFVLRLPALPPTIEEAVAIASPDASVWWDGSEKPTTITMTDAAMPRNQGCTGRGEAKRREGYVSVSRATTSQNERRVALGVSWQEIIENGLRATENANL